MKTALACFLIFSFLFCSSYILAQAAPATNSVSIKGFVNESRNSDWKVRYNLAKQLGGYHDSATFQVLLNLLKDKHKDVSYSAVEAIGARGDKQFDELFIEAIKTLPQDRRWYAFREAKNYPTGPMMIFLFSSLKKEILFYKSKKLFDDQNCFYLSQSLQSIVQVIMGNHSVKAPYTGDRPLSAYEHFVDELKEVSPDIFR